MRYLIFASDYDGTIASNGRVPDETIEKLKELKASGRILVLVTGREMRYLAEDFPGYKVFDHIVAENGAVLIDTATSKETLLGEAPDPAFVERLAERGIAPVSVGQVIVATWEPHEAAVLSVIKELGVERQVIFNKGAVMVLPAGLNKASGLTTLLRQLNLSPHNVLAIGDAENDSAMLAMAECGVAVANALEALKIQSDHVTRGGHGQGVNELIDQLLTDDGASFGADITRHDLSIGTATDGSPFGLSPYRSGLLLSGVSGGGKTTFTLSIVEALIKQTYQFCLIDPEGDYLELEGALVVGNETSVPSLEEIISLLREPSQNLVVCILSVPLADRPAWFLVFLNAYAMLRLQTGHPHWLLLDEAHHLLPRTVGEDQAALPEVFDNFILISTSVDRLYPAILKKIGTVLVVGNNWTYPLEHFAEITGHSCPMVPAVEDNRLLVWNVNLDEQPFVIHPFLPEKLLKRHKRKYAQGDMGPNSFVFTGPEKKMNLVASNVLLFARIAEGVDQETWDFHWQNGDVQNWFKEKIHDEDLAALARPGGSTEEPEDPRKKITEAIRASYTA